MYITAPVHPLINLHFLGERWCTRLLGFSETKISKLLCLIKYNCSSAGHLAYVKLLVWDAKGEAKCWASVLSGLGSVTKTSKALELEDKSVLFQGKMSEAGSDRSMVHAATLALWWGDQ